MTRKTTGPIAALTLACLVLAGCAGAPRGDREEFDAFAAQVNRDRHADPVWTEEERAAFAAATPPFQDLPAELVDRITGTHRPKGELTPAEAGEDVAAFFTLLQGAYGGYDYFGGDAVFLPLRDRLLAEVEARSAWTKEDMEDLLADALDPVVADGHFSIGDRELWQAHSLRMYYVPDLYFSDTAGLDPDLVKPTVGPDGAVTYCFAALSADGAGLPTSAVVEGRERVLAWREAERYQVQDRTAFRREVEGGIPVIVSRTMTADEENAGALEAFQNAGAQDRDAPVVILDIRGNGGGNDSYGTGWAEGLVGGDIHPKQLHRIKYSRLWGKDLEARGVDLPEGFGGWSEGAGWDGSVVPRKGVVLVLMDWATASAAESLVLKLRWVDNVVFLGSNTWGCTMFGNVMRCRLPHSFLNVRFGASMGWCGTGENIEGVGHLPDLWVPPEDAKDAAMRLCRYYGLPPAPPFSPWRKGGKRRWGADDRASCGGPCQPPRPPGRPAAVWFKGPVSLIAVTIHGKVPAEEIVRLPPAVRGGRQDLGAVAS